MRKVRTVMLTAVAAAGLYAAPAQAADCLGRCGSSDDAGFVLGDVGLSPTGNAYDWVSTSGGRTDAGRINRNGTPFDPKMPGERNGSELVSDAFFAAAGSKVEFFFNYVTSDGGGFADYGFAQLVNRDTNAVTNLFTARTKPEVGATIVPGQELPAVQATLAPPIVAIQKGTGAASAGPNGEFRGPVWGALGTASSGNCFSAGCGLTKWVQSTYTVQAEGSYELRFGVTNWSDQGFDSGLAFDGLLLDGNVIGDGTAADNPLLPDDLGPNGEFQFTFEVDTPTQVVFIDPDVAIGYDYVVGANSANILTALFPVVAGDMDGYDLFTLDDILIASGVAANTTFNFGPGGIAGFKLRDIEIAAGLDPTDQTAFVTGLTFAVGGPNTIINMTQNPIAVFVPGPGAIPEPSTWAMMILGFGLAGAAVRRRRGTALAG